MWDKRNQTLQDVLILKNNQRDGGNGNPASSHHRIIDLFPVTAQHREFYSLSYCIFFLLYISIVKCLIFLWTLWRVDVSDKCKKKKNSKNFAIYSKHVEISVWNLDL